MLSIDFICHSSLNLLFCSDYFFLVERAFKSLLKILWDILKGSWDYLSVANTSVRALTFNALALSNI